MDDLQLLELLEKAKEKQRGETGEPGVSVQKIEQFDDDSFTIFLSNGYSKKIQLFPGKDGEVGQQGVVGPKGDPGASGSPGRDGADGLAGAPGPRGADGSFVDTAIVNKDGDLLISLSTGEILNVGRVVGPVGATGATGPTGLPGADGEDGEAVLSGPRAPQAGDGKEGDHWIDISSAEFSFYKKSGDGWAKLANLRQPAKDLRMGVAGGGGSGGSGGPAAGYTTSNLPMTGLGYGGTRDGEDPGLGNPPPGGISKPGGNIIPEARSLRYQANFNAWAVDSLDALDDKLPVHKVDELPDEGAYDGDQVLFNDALWVYHDPNWVEVGGALDPCDFTRVTVGETPPTVPEPCVGDQWFNTSPDELTTYVLLEPGVWVPASPPVSLDGIEGDVTDLQTYIDTNITPALAGAVGDVRTLEAETARLSQGVDEAHQKADQLETELEATAETANTARAKNIEQDGRLDTLTELQGQDERDITALRSRVGGTEAKNTEQDGRLDTLESVEREEGNFAEKDGLNVFTRQNTFEARTVMNDHLTLQSNDDSHRLYVKNKTGETNLTLFPNGSISSKSHVNFTPSGASTFGERYSSYIRVDTPPSWSSGDGDFGLYVDISRGNTQSNRFVVGGRSSREKAFEVFDDGKGRARVYGDFTADNKITTNTLQVVDEAAIKNAEFTGTCDVSNASHSNNCALPKRYFSTVLKEFNSQFRSIYINHGTNGTSDPPIQIKASSNAGSLIELLNASNQARFGINVHNAYMYGGTAASPWMPSSDHHYAVKKYVDRQVETAIQVQNGPSGMWFEYGGQSSEPREGQFTLDSDQLFIDCINDDGVVWHAGQTTTSPVKIWSHCTIYELNNRGEYTVVRMHQLEEFQFRTRNSRQHLMFNKCYQKFGSGLPTSGNRYLLNIGGFF